MGQLFDQRVTFLERNQRSEGGFFRFFFFREDFFRTGRRRFGGFGLSRRSGFLGGTGGIKKINCKPDDHERNHGLLYDAGWRLAPAFDIATQGTALGYQGMILGAQGSQASLGNALSTCAHFGLAVEDATRVIEELIQGTDALASGYREAGVQVDAVERTRQHRDRTIADFGKEPAAGEKAVSRRGRRRS